MPTIVKARITKTVVDKLAADTVVRDTEIKGFGIRRQEGAPFTSCKNGLAPKCAG